MNSQRGQSAGVSATAAAGSSTAGTQARHGEIALAGRTPMGERPFRPNPREANRVGRGDITGPASSGVAFALGVFAPGHQDQPAGRAAPTRSPVLLLPVTTRPA